MARFEQNLVHEKRREFVPGRPWYHGVGYAIGAALLFAAAVSILHSAAPAVGHVITDFAGSQKTFMHIFSLALAAVAVITHLYREFVNN